MMMEGKRQFTFNIGDRVINLTGDREGTIVRLGPFGKTGHVKWDNGQQEMLRLDDLRENATIALSATVNPQLA
jgi:hypothetical protein